MASENIYCRLCAAIKSPGKLTLLSDTKCREINLKLSRLHSEINFDSNLPKTVCFVCLNSLEKALDFVIAVEQAQKALRDIFSANIKKEDSSLDLEFECSQNVKEEDFSQNFTYDVPIDDEDSEFPVKTEDRSENLSITKSYSKIKTSSKSLDLIPLSQLKLTWKDYTWVCSTCDTNFLNYDELKIHSIKHHNQCNVFRCKDCNKRKFKLRDFLIHVQRHRQYLKLSCYICHKKFSTLPKANKHKNEHVTSEFVCNGCHTYFDSSEELNEHTRMFFKIRHQRQSQTGQPLICPVCSKAFKQRGTYNVHVLIHTDRKRSHTCEICGKCYLNKHTLAGHMLIHNDTKPYPCKLCKKSFKTLSQLRAHIGVHDTNKPFSCDQCSRCFRLKKQLESHLIIHTDNLPYICSFCSKRFRFRTILNQHIRQHTGVKPYSCDLCQRDFTNWPNYNKHMKRRHNTDMSRKKRDTYGGDPNDPAMENVANQNDIKFVEWKNKMMGRRRGRPRIRDIEPSITETKENQSNE